MELFFAQNANNMQKIIDKQYIIEQYKTGKRSYNSLAQEFDVSYERIAQIVQNKKIIREKTRRAVYIRDNFLCQLNEKCKNKKMGKLVIWHLDRNKSNTALNNLITVCSLCSNFLVVLEKGGYKTRQCQSCKKECTYAEIYSIGKNCFVCMKRERAINKLYWCKKFKLYECIQCHSNVSPHQTKGLCLNCFSKNRYASSPIYRAQHKKAVMHWQKTHPEQQKMIQKKATTRYLEKNKDKIIAKRIANRTMLNARARHNYQKRKAAENNIVPNILKLLKEKGIDPAKLSTI